MTLKDWFSETGVTQREFAHRIGRSEATVSRLVNGVNRPDRATIRAIHKETGGAVTPNDFIDLDAVA